MKGIQSEQLSSTQSQRDDFSPTCAKIRKPVQAKGDKKKVLLLKKAFAFLAVFGIFYFLGKSLHQDFANISGYQWSLKWELLILSFFCLVMNLAVASYAWKKLLSFFQARLPFGQTFKIMSVSAVGKYAPGKVWQYLSQIYLGQKAGLPKSVTLFSTALLFVAYNLVGILVFFFSLFFWERFPPFLIALFLAVSVCLFMVALYPPVLNKVVRFLLRLFKREAPTIKAGFDQILKMLLILILDWMIFGLGVYLFVNSFYSLNLSQTVILCGIFAVSVISGILSFFVPAGLGVREGVQSCLLGLFIPISMAILISVVMRLWMTFGELACFVIALKIKEPKVT